VSERGLPDTLHEYVDEYEERHGITVCLQGEDAARGLPALVAFQLLRIVQEALTNVVKHARGAATEVSLHLADDHVDLDVINGPGGNREESSGGRGLLGMRERVVLYGGHLDAAPSQNGGFHVHAWIPVGRTP
jgi:signal transduction histidine kinase